MEGQDVVDRAASYVRDRAAPDDTRIPSRGGEDIDRMEARPLLFPLLNSNHSVPKGISSKCFAGKEFDNSLL